MKRNRIATGLALAFLLSGPASAVDLKRALDAAVVADPALVSATANREAAREGIEIARARLKPQVTLQSSIQRLDQSTNRSGTVTDFTGSSKSTNLQVRQAVYRPREWAGLRVGELQAKYSEFRVLSAASDLWNRASGAWLDVLAARAQQEVYARTVEAVSVTLEQERRRFEAGDGTRDAVAEAAAQVAQARAQLSEASLTLQARLSALNLLTRLELRDLDGFAMPRNGALPSMPISQTELVDRVLESNPELLGARVGEAIAEARLKQVSADHLPTLDLVASMNRAQNDTTNTFDTQYRNAQVGVQLVVPIYAGGGVNAAQRQAVATRSASVAERELTEQRLRIQVASDWSVQQGLRDRADAARELVAAMREQRRAIELGIKAGTRTWSDLGSTELQLGRRLSEQFSIEAAMLKSQARLLSLLPTEDPAWDAWVAAVSAASAVR